MAGKKPFFLTGGNARIIVNGVTLAFVTNLNYTTTVRHTAPRVLGKYEVEEHQPLSYEVNGAFTVIRYAKGLVSELGSAHVPEGVSDRGNGVGAWTQGGAGHYVRKALGLPNTNLQFDGRADDSFNPSRFFQSQQFDIEVRQMVHDQCGQIVAKIRDCRITSSDFSVSKRGAATETFQFKAVFADGDNFTARKSGVGQELS